MAKEAMKLVANNKKVYHDFFVDEKYEAGLVLHGTEVKSLRMGKCSIKEAFIAIDKGEVFINGMPLQVYFKDGKAKMEIGLCRGKKLYDKRQDIAKKDARRESEREFKVKNLY